MNRLIIYSVLLFSFLNTNAQQNHISMDKAIEKVRKEHPTVLRQDLYIKQQEILKDAGKNQPALGLGYTIEEFGVAGWGVQSVYIEQSFQMPQIAKRTAKMQTELAKVGEFQKKATQAALERYVASLYQQLLYSKSQTKMNKELVEIYKKVEAIGKKRTAAGESGELPVLATQTAKQQIELQELRNEQNYKIKLEELKQFLGDNTINGIADSVLVEIDFNKKTIEAEEHPLVQQIDQRIVANSARTKVIETQLLPQISTGLQFQIVNRTLPNFGAQLGVSVPIIGKGVKAQAQANEINSRILEQNKTWQIQQLEAKEQIAVQTILELQKQQSYIEKTLLPTLEKQLKLSRKSYKMGETDYLPVLQSLVQMSSARKMYLQRLFQLNLAWIDYRYLIGE